MSTRIAPAAARGLPAAERNYDFKGAVVRALKNDTGLDESAIPKAALRRIGSWTDTTQTYTSANIGKDKVYVHVDDELAEDGFEEGFIAANKNGVVVASGSLNQDDHGNLLPNTVRFDKKPQGMR
jgi:hypothetical protein